MTENIYHTQAYKNDRVRFDAADANGDGIVDESEWAVFFKPWLSKAMTEVTFNEVFMSMDTNGDGRIEIDEYANATIGWYYALRSINI